MIEIPPRFAGRSPSVQSRANATQVSRGQIGRELVASLKMSAATARGCAEAEKRIGHLYPKVEITTDMATDRADLSHCRTGSDRHCVALGSHRQITEPRVSHVDVPLVSSSFSHLSQAKKPTLSLLLRAINIVSQLGLGSPRGRRRTEQSWPGSEFPCILSKMRQLASTTFTAED